MRIEDVDFKKTYGAAPWHFEACVEKALCQTKEERVVKQFTIRSVALAMLSVFCLMAVCFATVLPGDNQDVLVTNQNPQVTATNPVTTQSNTPEQLQMAQPTPIMMAQPTPIVKAEPTPIQYFNKGQESTYQVNSPNMAYEHISRVAEFYWQRGCFLKDAVRLRRGEGVVAPIMSEYVDSDVSFCLEEVVLLKENQSTAPDMIGAKTNLTMLFTMKPGNENVYLVSHVGNIDETATGTQKTYAQLMAEGKTVLHPWAMLSGVRVGDKYWETHNNQYSYTVTQEDGSLQMLHQATQEDHPIEEIWAAAEAAGGMSLEINLAVQDAAEVVCESKAIIVHLEF